MPMKGQPIRKEKYDRYSLEATVRRRESSRVKVARWRKENPDKYREQLRAYRERKKAEIKERQKKYFKANEDKCRQLKRKSHLKNEYGISVEEYTQIWEGQGRVCAICRKSPEKVGEKFHLDHDHEHGIRRGILCPRCNHGLGHFRDDPELLLKAVEYLKRGDLLRTI